MLMKEKYKKDDDKDKPRRRALSLLPVRKKKEEEALAKEKREEEKKKKPKDDTNKHVIRNFSFRGKVMDKFEKPEGIRSTSAIVPSKSVDEGSISKHARSSSLSMNAGGEVKEEGSDVVSNRSSDCENDSNNDDSSDDGRKADDDNKKDSDDTDNEKQKENEEQRSGDTDKKEDYPTELDLKPETSSCDLEKKLQVDVVVNSPSIEDLESGLPVFYANCDPSPLFMALSSRVQEVIEDVSRIAINSSENSPSSRNALLVLYSKLLFLLRKTIELAKAIKDSSCPLSPPGSPSPNSPPSPSEIIEKVLMSTLEFLASSASPTISSDPHILAAAGLSEGIAKLVPKQVIQKINLECDSLRLLGIHLISTLSTLKGQTASLSANSAPTSGSTKKKKQQVEIPNDIFMQLVTIAKSLPPVMNQLMNTFQTLEEIRIQAKQRELDAEKSDAVRKVQVLEADDDVNIWEEKREITDTKCGNLNMLVNRLTSADSLDQNFLHTFVVTYRSFTTPYKLVEKLFQRYNVAEGNAKKNNIQMRVVIVIKYWVENQFFDFDDELVDKLIHFIDCVLPKDMGLGDRLKNTINKKVDQRSQAKATQLTIPDSLTNSPFSSLSDLILQTNEEDIAKQLTLIDWKNFLNIETSEYLNQAWNKEELKYRSTNLLTMISRLNKLSYWISSIVLFQERLSARVNMFCKFINLAQHLFKLNNYCSLMGVLAGLNMSSLLRLHHTRNKVPSKMMASLKSLEKIMNPENSYKNYRFALQSGGNPKLPYLGVDLRDLTFIEDGNPDLIDSMINFQKRELVYSVIQDIQTLKNDSYNFPVQEPLYTLLNELPSLSEKDLYELSLTREPRNSTAQQVVQ